MSDHHDLVSLTSEQAAEYLGVSKAALQLWRSQDVGPRYFKAGEKLVRYRACDLEMWIEARLSPGVSAEQVKTQLTAV